MGKLGKAIELPDESIRRSLLLHPAVAIHDEQQQNYLLRESERWLLAFRNSDLYSLLQDAKRRLEEVPYIIIRDGKELEFRPDLIVEDQYGDWHIVDYKTDKFDIKQLNKRVKEHQAQLTNYVADLETILGVSSRAWLYFADHGRLEPVNTAAPVQLSLFS
jgi:ATP-dependent exoDNAse (exonuclease V) beta subunit